MDGRHNATSQNYTKTHAQCYECLDMLPKNNFTPDIRVAKGVGTRCDACLSIFRKKRAEELGRVYQGIRPKALKVKKDKTWYDNTHAECLKEGCGIHSKDKFYNNNLIPRGCSSYCKEHTEEYKKRTITPEQKKKWAKTSFEKKASDLILTTYKSYKRKRRENAERFEESPEVDMTLKEFAELWPKDNICPYYHRFLEIKPGGRTGSSPSIDRINNKKGYRRDNIEIVCWHYNCDKGTMSVEDQFAQGGVAAKRLGYKWPPEPITM